MIQGIFLNEGVLGSLGNKPKIFLALPTRGLARSQEPLKPLKSKQAPIL